MFLEFMNHNKKGNDLEIGRQVSACYGEYLFRGLAVKSSNYLIIANNKIWVTLLKISI